MSLINQMLRDLEKRRRDETSRTVLPSSLRLAEESAKPQRMLLRGALVVALAVGGWVFVPQQAVRKSAPPPATQTMDAKTPTPLPADPLANEQAPAAQAMTVPALASGPVAPMAQEDRPAAPPVEIRAPVPAEKPSPEAKEVKVQSIRPKPLPAGSGTKVEKPSVRKTLVASQAGSDETAERLYRQGARFYASGQTARAVDALERSLALDPADHRARLLLAKSHAASGNLERGQELLDELAGAESDIEATRLRIHLLLKRGAIEQAQKALEHSPVGEDHELRGLLGALRQRQGRHEEAAETYGQLARDEPEQSRWWLGLAISLEARERFEEALDGYRRALAAGAPSPQVQDYIEARIRALRADR